MAGIAWTREVLLERAGLRLPEDLGKAITRTVEALDAETPVVTYRKGEMEYTSGGEPDHDIRLKAADRIFDLADVRKPRNDGADPNRPVNVNIVLAQADSARQLARAEGVVLTFPAAQELPQVVSGQAITEQDELSA